MKREKLKLLLIVMLALTLIYVPNAQSSGTGTISGVLFPDILVEDLSSIEITVFDSVNAEIIDALITINPNGDFLGSLPVGSYKLYFKGKNLLGPKGLFYCFEGFFASGGSLIEAFALAKTIGVKENLDTGLGSVSVTLQPCGSNFCSEAISSITGNVFDSSTNQPIPGIQVLFKEPYNAFPIYELIGGGYVTTDGNGDFSISDEDEQCDGFDTKIRFYDPLGIYNAEYFNSSNTDNFEQGAVVDWGLEPAVISEGLAKITPSQQVGDLIGDIGDVLLPEDAQPLVSPLLQAIQLLDDTNPNNDSGACGVLNGTIAKLTKQVSDGNLTPEEADAIAASIETIRNDLGCK